MYDHSRGVHYISRYCAMCNGATDVEPWNVTCKTVPQLEAYQQYGVMNSTESLMDIWNSNQCYVSGSSQGVRKCYLGNVISTCPSSCLNEWLIKGCESGYQAFITVGLTGVTYKNGYCAACHSQTGTTISCDGSITVEAVLSPAFSLTNTFNFDVRKQPTKKLNANCRPGFVHDNDDCIPEASNITVTINGTFGSELLIIRDVELLEQEIGEKVTSVMETFSISHRNVRVLSNLEPEKNKLVVVSYIQCNCDYSSLHDSITYERFGNEILSKVKIEIILYLEERNIQLESVDSEIEFEINNITSNTICKSQAAPGWFIKGMKLQ